MERQPRQRLDEIPPADLPEVVRVASELYAHDRAEMERAKERQELLQAAAEAGLPAEYLERAAATIQTRHATAQARQAAATPSHRQRHRRMPARVWIAIGVALFSSRIMGRSVFQHPLAPPLPLFTDGATELSTALLPAITPLGPCAPIDLRGKTNRSLYEAMLATPGNDLANLGSGSHTLRGVPFRTSGVVLVGPGETSNGSGGEAVTVAKRVEGIPVGRKANRIFFLNGTHWHTDNGITIGDYSVHYADGTQTEIPIRYGEDVLDWWTVGEAGNGPAEQQIAWMGRNDAASRGDVPIRLFMKAWQNPRPNVPIRSIDVATGDQPPGPGAPAPFLVGLTVETAPAGGQPGL